MTEDPDQSLDRALRIFLRDKQRAIYKELRGLGDDQITVELMAAVGLYSSVANHCYGEIRRFLDTHRAGMGQPPADPVVDSPPEGPPDDH